jgi:hypothetical protein
LIRTTGVLPTVPRIFSKRAISCLPITADTKPPGEAGQAPRRPDGK